MAVDGSVVRTSHAIAVGRPAAEAAALIKDVRWWPLLFEGIVHVEVLDRTAAGDRLRLWAVDAAAARALAEAGPEAEAETEVGAGRVLRSWTARREFVGDPALTVRFRQEEPSPPLATMGGSWRFPESPDGTGCRVELSHEARVADGGAARHPWVGAMVAEATRSQLAGIRAAMGRPGSLSAAVVDRQRSTAMPPATAERLPELAREHGWPPHPDAPRAGTRIGLAPDAWLVAEPTGRGDRRLTVCLELPGGRIVTKRLQPPPAVIALTGEWLLRSGPGSGDGPGTRLEFRRRALLAAGRGPLTGRGRAAERLGSALEREADEQIRRVSAV